MKTPLTDMTPEEIAEALELQIFQGRQIFQWLHQNRVFRFGDMTNLSKDLRRRMDETCLARQLELVRMETSAHSAPQAGTKKALFRLEDGETIESVWLEDRHRITLCVSSQVGCPLECSFCATGHSGFRRNLSAGEIVEQALHLLVGEPIGERTPNIVYMGMGEPFLNYDAVVKSIRLLMREEGLEIGARKITVSTAGVVPGIRRFTDEDWQVRLAISLHGANDALRSKLLPENRTYPLKKLIGAVHDYVFTTGRQVSFEWVLLKGVNDSVKQAQELADLIGGLKAVVNLIPYNSAPGLPFEPPAPAVCEAFRDNLTVRGVPATLRQERGQDIDAACGQLRSRALHDEP